MAVAGFHGDAPFCQVPGGKWLVQITVGSHAGWTPLREEQEAARVAVFAQRTGDYLVGDAWRSEGAIGQIFKAKGYAFRVWGADDRRYLQISTRDRRWNRLHCPLPQ